MCAGVVAEKTLMQMESVQVWEWQEDAEADAVCAGAGVVRECLY